MSLFYLAVLISFRTESISSILFLAIKFLCLINSLVSTDCCIPEVEDIYFCFLWASKAITFMNFNSDTGIVENDIHYLLSLFNSSSLFFSFSTKTSFFIPIHLTSPPCTDLEALPEPKRANYES